MSKTRLPYISPDILEQYKGHVRQTSSEATSKRRMSSLKRFADWAEKEGHTDQNPFQLQESIKATEQKVKPSEPTTTARFSKPKKETIKNIFRVSLAVGMAVLVFLLLRNVKLPINFIPAPAKEGEEIVQVLPSPSPQPVPGANENVDINAIIAQVKEEIVKEISGVLEWASFENGNLLIGGSPVGSITLQTGDNTDGDIEINPDGDGIVHFLFEGTGQNYLNAQAPNLNSGSLFYGIVANNSTGYDLLRLQSGSTPTTRFSVDATGDVFTAGIVDSYGGFYTSSVERLTPTGSLTNITGYSQISGNFSIDQGAGDTATISKTNTTALSDLMILTLDERPKPENANSSYSTLVLRRYDGANEAAALYVDVGNAIFDEQLLLGRYAANPANGIGEGSIIYNTVDDTVYVWDGSAWITISGSSSFADITSGTNTQAAMVVGTGASLDFTGTGTINASSLNSLTSGQFLRSDTSDSYTSGTLTFDAGTTIDINGDLVVSDTNVVFDGATTTFTTTGDLTIDSGGGQVIFADGDTLNVGGLTEVTYNAFANAGEAPEEAAISSDNDLYIGGDLEVDGAFYGDGSGLTGVNADTLDTLDSTQFLRSDTSDNFTSGTLTTDAGTTLDVNGDLIVSDTDVVFDAANTTFTITGDLTIDPGGSDVTIDGNLILSDTFTLQVGGLTATTYNAFANAGEAPEEAAISSDNDLYIGGDLEVDGIIYGTLFGAAGSVAWDDITSPDSNLSLPMSTFTTTFSWDSTGNADLFSLNYDNAGGTAGTDRVLVLGNALSDNVAGDLTTEALLVLDQADTTVSGNTALTDGLLITNSGGSTFTNAITIGSGSQTIGTALNIASTGVTTDIRLQNGETIDNNTDGTILLTSPTTSLSGDLVISGNDITFGNGETISNAVDGVIAITSPSTTLSGDLAVNGGDITTTSTTFNIDVANTGTINFRDGTNTLIAIKDQGVYPFLNVAGKTDTGDPVTCAEGDLYYNAFDDTIKICHSGSVWEALDGGGGSSVWSDLTDPTADLTLLMAEYETLFNWDLATDAALDGFSLTLTNDLVTDTSTQRLLVLENSLNAVSGGTTEALLLLDQADTTASGNTALTDGLLITNSGGSTFTNAITIGSGTQAITTALNIASTGVTTDISLQNGETIDNNTDGTVLITSLITSLSGDLAVNGGDITSTVDLTIDAAGGQVIFADGDTLNIGGLTGVTYNAFANAGEAPEEAAISSDNDVYIGGDLEVDGVIYGSVSGGAGSVAWDDITAPDADLTLGMGVFSTTFNWDPGADSAETAFTLTTQGEDTTGGGDEDQILLALAQTDNGVDVDQAADALLTFANNDPNDPVINAIRFDAGGAGTDFTYGINFDAASFGTAELILSNSETIDNLVDGTVLITSPITSLSGDLAVNGGDITSTGSLTLTPTTTLSLNSTGDLTLDSSADIILDADGADILFQDGGAAFATFTNSTTDLTIDVAGGQLILADTDTINIGGLTGVAYNAFANAGEAPEEAAISSDNDVYIGGDLEVDGTLYANLSGSIGGFTQGSVIFADSSGFLEEDNANFFWDDTNNFLGLGNATPTTQLHIGSNAETHSLGTSDVLISSDLELDGVLYLDGGTISNVAGTGTILLSSTPITTANNLSAGSWLVENTANVGMAALLVNQTQAGDIFTASASAGTTRFVIANNGTVTITTTNNALTSSLVVNDATGTGTGKIDVGTVDPPYTINGKKYATYLSAMIGVKEEVVGQISTNEYLPGVGYRYIVDFNNLPEGSDLWLFGKTTNIKENIDQLVALLTPSGSTRVWYEVDEENAKLAIYSARPTNISYRLTAPRFDGDKWANTRDYDNDVEGFVLNDPDTINTNPFLTTVYGFSDFILENMESGFYLLKDSSGVTIDGLEAAGNFIAANIKAGAIVTKEITSDQITAFTGTIDNLLIGSGLISPVVQTALISPLPDETDVTVQIGNTGTDEGVLSIQNVQGDEVASIDTQGNAEFNGQVTSDGLQSNNATIAGELRAGKIYADEIIGGNQGVTLEEIEELLRQAQEDQNLIADSQNWNVNTATDSASLDTLALSTLYVTQSAAINSLSVTEALAIGTDLAITGNSIDTITSPLSLQSLALAPVEIMAGRVRIDTNGDVTITGNLFVAGQIESQGLTLQGAVSSDFGNLLTLKDAAGNEVGIVDATGSAKFKSVETGKFIVAGASEENLALNAQGEIETNATAGVATIAAGQEEIVIRNPNITNQTLVYITPTSPTQNKVLFVKSKDNGYFTAGFTDPINVPVSFNWWVVDVGN